MRTYRLSSTVAVTTPIYIGVTEPPDCLHLWDDVPYTEAFHADKAITLTMQKCESCGGTRTKIVGSRESLDKVLK